LKQSRKFLAATDASSDEPAHFVSSRSETALDEVK